MFVVAVCYCFFVVKRAEKKIIWLYKLAIVLGIKIDIVNKVFRWIYNTNLGCFNQLKKLIRLCVHKHAGKMNKTFRRSDSTLGHQGFESRVDKIHDDGTKTDAYPASSLDGIVVAGSIPAPN